MINPLLITNIVNMFFVYVLYFSDDGKFYVDCTSDLKKRILEHKNGKVSSTNERGSFKLIFYEAFISNIDAKRREEYLKTPKGKITLRIILRGFLS